MISLKQLNILQKYCDNRVDKDKFIELMKVIGYSSESYIEPLWPQFTNSPIRFITSRNEKRLLTAIFNSIYLEGYDG